MLTLPWAGNPEMRNKVGQERRITRAQFQTPTGSNSIKTEDPRWNNQHFIPPCNSSTYLPPHPGHVHKAKPFFLTRWEWDNGTAAALCYQVAQKKRESKHALVSLDETELSYGRLITYIRFGGGHYSKPAGHLKSGQTLFHGRTTQRRNCGEIHDKCISLWLKEDRGAQGPLKTLSWEWAQGSTLLLMDKQDSSSHMYFRRISGLNRIW